MSTRRYFTKEEQAEIVKMYQSGTSIKAIARHFGLKHHSSVSDTLDRLDIKKRAIGEDNRLYKLDNTMFDVIDTEEKAYWLGFLYADGCLSRGKTLYLILAERDGEHVNTFKQFMRSESPLKHIVSNRSTYGESKQIKIEITDKHLGERMSELGMNTVRKMSGYGSLPFISEHLVHHWIRGWCDGDGSVGTKDESIGFCGTQELLLKVRSILADEKGLNPELQIKMYRHMYYLIYKGYFVANKVADYLYQDATVYLPRKREIINNWRERFPRERDDLGRYV